MAGETKINRARSCIPGRGSPKSEVNKTTPEQSGAGCASLNRDRRKPSRATAGEGKRLGRARRTPAPAVGLPTTSCKSGAGWWAVPRAYLSPFGAGRTESRRVLPRRVAHPSWKASKQKLHASVSVPPTPGPPAGSVPRPEPPLQANEHRLHGRRGPGGWREKADPTFLPPNPRPRDPGDIHPPAPPPAERGPGVDRSAPCPSSRGGLRGPEQRPSGLRPAAHVQGGRREEGEGREGKGRRVEGERKRAACGPAAQSLPAARPRRLRSQPRPPPRLHRLGPVPTPGLARPLGGPHPPRLPTAPPSSSPAARSLDRPGEGSKRASAPSPQPRAPAPRGDEGPGR